jgi:hypothetical protein
MLEDDVRNVITINFSEPIDTLSQNNENSTKSVTVYDWTNGTYITPASIVIAGSSVTVTLTTPLTDGQEFDVNLLITDFKDTAGNMLMDSNSTYAINGIEDSIDPSGNNQAIRVSLKAYDDLNTNANVVTLNSQAEKDTTTTIVDATNDALRAYSNAFNDAALGVSSIQQLNAPEADMKLQELAAAQGFAIDMNTTSARIAFTASGAAQYKITRRAKNGSADINAYFDETSMLNVLPAGLTDNNSTTSRAVYVKPVSNNSPVELTLSDAAIGDVITITPQDDFAYNGTPALITLADNVAPTTMLQKAYMGNVGTTTGSVIQVLGNGGELTNGYSVAATAGTPILAVTPGLLDNLMLSGTTVVDIQSNTVATQPVSDNNLQEELFAHNTPTTITTDAADVLNIDKDKGIYDTAAYNTFITNLSRKVGVAFTEDINLSGVTPTFTGTTLSSTFTAINNVKVDDNNKAIDGNTSVGATNVDLVEFTTSNVIDLANNNNGAILSFDGIKDAAGNVASNADVVLQDYMPPFVVSAKYDGDMTFVFNEAITAPTDTAPLNFRINDAVVPTETADINLTGSNKTSGTITQWSLSTDMKTLVVYSPLVKDTNASNKVSSIFDIGSYIESSYGATTAKNHTILDFSAVKDSRGNSWDTWATASRDLNDSTADMGAPLFAMIDMIGAFGVSLDTDNVVNFSATSVNGGTLTTSIKWVFNHAIANFGTYEYNSTSNKFIVSGGAESTGTSEYALTTGVDLFFSYAKASAADVNITLGNTPVVTISGDRKSATLTFKDMNVTSNFDGTNAIAGDSLNLRADLNVSSSLTEETTPTRVSATVQ